jgi:pimeloyl-ACP methyl ester carboxylesterase
MYAQDENWLCAPGIATNFCEREDLRTTVIAPDGTTTVSDAPPAADPAFDCFYVYPTVNLTGGPGTDDAMAADSAAEQAVLRNQFSRFRTVCTPYAPLYRQITLTSFAAPNREELQARAYGDVHNAFAHYMAHWNRGRPVLLVGHSQGSGLLAQLLAADFDDDPALRAQLVSAMLIGGFTTVPVGADAGGTLDNIPACRSATQTACVIGYNSVAADGPLADIERWGGAAMPGQVPSGEQTNLTRLCTNPANLAGGSGPLEPIVPNQGSYLASGAPVDTPFVELPDALTAQCTTTPDNLTTLAVSPASAPGDSRDTARLSEPVPGWGLHINEVNLTLGNLLEIAASQGAAIR